MKKYLVSLLAVLIGFSPVAALAEEEDFSASGYNNQRIEQEDKLWVPMEKADEVWAYLESTLVTDQSYIQSIDPAFSSYWNLEEFWDVYYDSPTFQVHEQGNGVRHRTRTNLTNPEDDKSGRELMQIKLNNLNNNPLSRGEIKFDIEPSPVNESIDDTHPMLGLVKASHRSGFKSHLEDMGLDPYTMKPILTVHDMRSRVYILKDGKSFMSVSFDRVDTRMWWSTYRFIEIEPELNEIAYTEANPETRAYMETVLAKITGDLQKEFPFIERNLTPKYSKSLNALRERIPFLPILVKLNIHTTSGMAFVICIILALGAFGSYYFVQRRRRSLMAKRLAVKEN